MKSFNLFLTAFLWITAVSFGAAPDKIHLQAEAARLDSGRVEVVEQKSFKSGEGVALRAGVESHVESPDAAPDLVFSVKPSQAGRYVFRTHAAVDDTGRELMEKSKTKHDSLFLRIAVGDGRATKRVVFVPWSAPESCVQTLGKFDLTKQEQEVRIWLPKHVRLDYLEARPYVAPKVPEAAAQYQPKVVPPPSHPRLWINRDSLPKVKANLTRGENAAVWKKLQAEARKPFEFEVKPGTAVDYNTPLETAAVNKAFVYLMTGDKAMGRQAVDLMRDYLQAVEFGNLLDITREIGRAMYAGAQVYDWCYDLMTPEERETIRLNMMRLADDMEIGWPPFKQGVVNGHGSEAQLLCHLLSMSIAIYDEDPVPYQYCAYRILEELVPMRDFEYQSPRHSQGIGYGIYRFGWDMHAAWLMYRMSGEEVFDDQIKDVRKYWLYMRLPGGGCLADGDGSSYEGRRNLGILALLTGAYARDPMMKAEFVREGGLRRNPIMVLLLNDPGLEPAEDLTSLPLTLDLGPVVGGMVARTGWDMEPESSDVIAAMTGGGYHFGNHQQADAGSFQIYYHGMQVADLGQYVFYGTPYDMNFNKRSIAHSMMLAYDPNEKFGGGKRLNDGGARFEHTSPRSPKMVKTDPKFANGTILSTDFGPAGDAPDYSFFSVDLTSAYSDKLRNYVRTFCFLNLKDEQTPAALIVVDHMETSGPEVRKYWQANTLTTPTMTAGGAVLHNSVEGKAGKVFLQMLKPDGKGRRTELLSGAEVHNVFGHQLTPPQPDRVQANGHRLLFSPAVDRAKDTFVTVMTMAEDSVATAPVELSETREAFVLSLADKVVVLSKTGDFLERPFIANVASGGESQLILTGLKPGEWRIQGDPAAVNGGEKFDRKFSVKEGRNTAAVMLQPGRYLVTMTD